VAFRTDWRGLRWSGSSAPTASHRSNRRGGHQPQPRTVSGRDKPTKNRQSTAFGRLRLHDLRHTHASLLLAAGVPVKEVADRLGHTEPTITLSVYAHLIPSMCQSANRWSGLMSGAARCGHAWARMRTIRANRKAPVAAMLVRGLVAGARGGSW